MTDDGFKKNFRVQITSSAIPNATSFVGCYGVVSWVDRRSIGVVIDGDHDPIMFFKREATLCHGPLASVEKT